MCQCCKSNTGCCGIRGMKIWAVVSALFGIACFSVAIWLPDAINTMLNNGINDLLVIDAQDQADGTSAYNAWVNPDDADATPIYYTVYMFNVTNSMAVVNAGATPDVMELGPYVYLEKVYKRLVTFSTNDYQQQLVSYQTQTEYVFQPSMSKGAESDVVTNVNIPFWATRSNNTGSLYALYPNDYSRMFVTLNVSAWLWGYPDSTFTYLSESYPGYVQPYQGLLGPNQNAPTTPVLIDTQFVGAAPDNNLIRTYTQFESESAVLTATFIPPSTVLYPETWGSDAANRITGTDGTIFQRGLQDGQTVQVYVNQLRRTVVLGNVNNVKVTYKNIHLLKFVLPDVFLGNAATYEPNAAFYMFGYTGVANLTATGTPDFYVTKPHYLDADPELLERLTGISAPDADLHDTFLNVEPISGITMQAYKRLQLSVRIAPFVANIPINVQRTQFIQQLWGGNLPNQDKGQYVPVYWAEESASISDSDANSFVKSVYGAQNAALGIQIAGEAAAVLAVAGALYLVYKAMQKAANGGDTTDNRVVPLEKVGDVSPGNN